MQITTLADADLIKGNGYGFLHFKLLISGRTLRRA